MERVFNFAPGPATMPFEVLQSIEKNICNFEGEGLSVMEMSHRSKTYEKIINETRDNLRTILNVPSRQSTKDVAEKGE